MNSRTRSTSSAGQPPGAASGSYYEHEAVPQAAGGDMVFVNLFRAPPGEPMRYPSTYAV
ncbi:hypothetical protein ACIRQP_41485 [Streptomyces sp. NPDC102274]|uniref:hypothetical protein n=1 Tax=Streptomyces sp. NPDC102274 TaxID=3366151 RepID=UPI00381C99D4